jgi:anti-sigma regulatory factor (Ser/Thr protein kinase)
MMGYVFMRFGADFRPEAVDRLREKVGECLERGGIVGTTSFLLLNLMDELICNILEHSKANWVELEMHPEPKEVKLILRDDGPKFDPGDTLREKEKELDEAVHGEGRHMGLYMVGQIVSSWNYERTKADMNELHLAVDLTQHEE